MRFKKHIKIGQKNIKEQVKNPLKFPNSIYIVLHTFTE